MWKGSNLPNDLDCDCKYGKPHHTDLYQENAITKYAREFPAGTSMFFQTDFQQAFEESQVRIAATCIDYDLTSVRVG